MPQTPNELIAAGIDTIKLDVLVFGPQVECMSSDAWTNAVQSKRIEIKVALENEGHNARYAEEVVDPNVNAFLQEVFLMKEYDLIINLIGSPGANIELGAIASQTEIANRSQLFLDSNHVGGLAGPACEHAETLGAFVHHYNYPNDLTECHLLGTVMDRVRTAQTQKYFA